MTALLTPAPSPEAVALVNTVPGLAVEPTVLLTQAGPAAELGPESAGAVLILQATFADAERQRGFWDAVVPLTKLLSSAPGMIRRFSFIDGPTLTLLALWRALADAQAFGASPEHRAAVRELYRQRWQYTHFSALWEMVSNHDRIVFCDHCDGITPISERVCRGCGRPFADPYRSAAGTTPGPGEVVAG
jgi:hypothetical protein